MNSSSKQLCIRRFKSAEHILCCRENQTAWRYGTRRPDTRVEESVTDYFSIIFGRIRCYRAELTSAVKWVSFRINNFLWLKWKMLRNSAAAETAQIKWQLKASVVLDTLLWLAGKVKLRGKWKSILYTWRYCITAKVLRRQHSPRIFTDWASVKAIPLQPWTGLEGSRRLGLPDFKTIGTWRR